ncbi:MAG: hypothetical protein AAF488_12115 [Planctomycetota bacterium]
MMNDPSTIESPKPRSKTRSVLILGVIVMATIIILLIPSLFDIDSIDDTDLLPPRSLQVDPRENVFTEIVRVHGLLVEPEEYFDFELGSSDPETSDEERLHELVAANEAYYAELLPLLDRPHFIVSDPKTFEDTRPHVLAIRSAGIWIGHRHDALILRGKAGEAAELALLWERAIRRHYEHVPSLIEFLVFIALYDASLDRLIKSACQAGVDGDALRRLSEAAAKPIDLFAAYNIAMCHEYRMARNFIDSLSSRYGSVARPFVFKPNRTRRELARVTRTCLEAVRTRDISALTELEQGLGQGGQLELIVSGNSVGQSLVRMLTPSYSTAIQKLIRVERSQPLYRAAIALRRYEVKRGQLPATLEELVPEFLEPGVLNPDDPILFERDLRWIGYEKPGDLKATAAPGIEVTTWVP